MQWQKRCAAASAHASGTLVVDGFTAQDRVPAAGAVTQTRVLRDKLGNSLAQLWVVAAWPGEVLP
jgi:hypothetical protein